MKKVCLTVINIYINMAYGVVKYIEKIILSKYIFPFTYYILNNMFYFKNRNR